MDQDATCYGGRPRPTRHRVRCGPATRRKKHTHPNPIFDPCLLWPDGWMKTPLGTEIDLGPGHIVLEGSKLLRKDHSSPPPLFGPCLLWPRRPSQLLLSSCYNSFMADLLVVLYFWTAKHVYTLPCEMFLLKKYPCPRPELCKLHARLNIPNSF